MCRWTASSISLREKNLSPSLNYRKSGFCPSSVKRYLASLIYICNLFFFPLIIGFGGAFG
jgi:hypothetical protein